VACRHESAPTRPRRPCAGDRQHLRRPLQHYFTKSEYRQFTAAVNQDRSGSIGISIEEVCAGATSAPRAGSTELAVETCPRPAGRAGGAAQRRRAGRRGREPGGGLGNQPGRPAVQLSNRLTVRGRRSRSPSTARARSSPSPHPREPPGPTVYSGCSHVLDLQVTSFARTPQDAWLAERAGSPAGDRGGSRPPGNGGATSPRVTLASQFLTRHAGEQDVVVRRGRMDLKGQPRPPRRDPRSDQSGGLAPPSPWCAGRWRQRLSFGDRHRRAPRLPPSPPWSGRPPTARDRCSSTFRCPMAAISTSPSRVVRAGGESIDGTGIAPATW